MAGIGGNSSGCTKCMHLDRDKYGRLWRKDQMFQVIEHKGHEVTILHRWEAFGDVR